MVSFRVLLIGVPYYIGDPTRDPNFLLFLESHPSVCKAFAERVSKALGTELNLRRVLQAFMRLEESEDCVGCLNV